MENGWKLVGEDEEEKAALKGINWLSFRKVDEVWHGGRCGEGDQWHKGGCSEDWQGVDFEGSDRREKGGN
ncbi:hypothetical protein E2C01_075542 [Portunus trituberculatus]|uniref:Uncharacterized protein n=1 Tax=Portunus trituberculatus TaxID=210409 RepID=A0A5B7IKF9_PORTR|nr:hypothetical protein [Portunus trituberculatus]